MRCKFLGNIWCLFKHIVKFIAIDKHVMDKVLSFKIVSYVRFLISYVCGDGFFDWLPKMVLCLSENW